MSVPPKYLLWVQYVCTNPQSYPSSTLGVKFVNTWSHLQYQYCMHVVNIHPVLCFAEPGPLCSTFKRVYVHMWTPVLYPVLSVHSGLLSLVQSSVFIVTWSYIPGSIQSSMYIL